MIYHDWSDKTVDWQGIEDAAKFIHDYCVRWSRTGGQYKEKFGQVRFYADFGYLSLHKLVYPGYAYNQFPQWLWVADLNYIGPVLRFLFGKLHGKWECIIYRRAYSLAIKKWPHLSEEILSGADYNELLKGL